MMATKRNCLLIDDDIDDHDVFRMCLNTLDPNVSLTSVKDCAEALAMLHVRTDYSPEFIFLDVNMPKMNGLECLKYLRKIDRLKSSKIYMYSTTNEKTTVFESLRYGAEDFIMKPAKTAELKDKLAKVFKMVSRINEHRPNNNGSGS